MIVIGMTGAVAQTLRTGTLFPGTTSGFADTKGGGSVELSSSISPVAE